MRVTVQATQVVDIWELIPLELVAYNSYHQGTDTVTKDNYYQSQEEPEMK